MLFIVRGLRQANNQSSVTWGAADCFSMGSSLDQRGLWQFWIWRAAAIIGTKEQQVSESPAGPSKVSDDGRCSSQCEETVNSSGAVNLNGKRVKSEYFFLPKTGYYVSVPSCHPPTMATCITLKREWKKF